MSCCFTLAPAPEKPGRRATRWPGISAAASDLGVSRGHLYAVLEGERESRALLSKYRAWVSANPSLKPRLPSSL